MGTSDGVRLGWENRRRNNKINSWNKGKGKHGQVKSKLDMRLKRYYGISEDDFNDMLAKQNGVCLLCGKTNKNGRILSVDHCHKTGRVRGLLCCKCNTQVGAIENNLYRLEGILEYIEGGKHD